MKRFWESRFRYGGFVVIGFFLTLAVSAGSIVSAAPRAGLLDGTENVTLESGVSGAVTLSIPEISLDKMNQEAYFDAFFYRHRQFVFGRRGNRLYFNIHNGKTWCAYIDSDADFQLEANRTYHLAFVLSVHKVPATGELWTDVVLYADGKDVGTARIMDQVPVERKQPVQFAQANGFGNGWNCAGTLYDMRFFDRALDAEELRDLAAKEPRIRFVPDGVPEVPAALEAKLAGLRRKASALAGADKAVADALICALTTLARTGDENGFHRSCAAVEKCIGGEVPELCGAMRLLRSDRTLVVLSSPGNAVLTWYDLACGRPLILGAETRWWQAVYSRGKKRLAVRGNAPEVRLGADNGVARDAETARWTTHWSHDDFAVEAKYEFGGDSLYYELSVTAGAGARLEEVAFPMVKLAPLPEGDLLIPCMSGAVKKNAVANRIAYSGFYPSGHASMQFGAYYDERSGVYFAAEDGRARSKSIVFRAKKNAMDVAWHWPVAFPTGAGEKSFFSPRCRGVLRRFAGDWYDAGILYRDFLENSAIWYKTARPVTEYPRWFRENTFWVSLRHREDSAEKLAKLQEYFELPFAVHYYDWFGKFNRDYPHHRANPQHYLWMRELRAMGLRVVPYVNGRLWEFLDRRDTDYQYSRYGKPDAVKFADGSVQTEKYSEISFAVMCPACGNWRKQLTDLTARVLGLEVDGVYFDQIGAAPPRLCFDRTHPHAPDDPDSWYMNGYRKLLLDLCEKHPDAVWTTEDNAEPYVGLTHGMLPWRWMVDGNVPLFNFLYSGKMELVGRSFGSDTPLTRKVKIYQQLIQGEQLGWCPTDFICQPEHGELLLVIKRAMHLRRGFLDYFQRGVLGRPPVIRGVKSARLKWGRHGDQMVLTPAVTAMTWRWAGRELTIIVNQSDGKQTFAVRLPGTAGRRVFLSVSGQGECAWEREEFAIAMPPQDIAVILRGDGEDFVREAERLRNLFGRVRNFTKIGEGRGK